MDYQTLQIQDDKICSYFRTTTEPYDYLECDGAVLKVWNENKVMEIYKYKDLKNLITNL